MVSKAPRSGADCEQSECSTDLRKYHPRARYQKDTAGGRRRRRRGEMQTISVTTL